MTTSEVLIDPRFCGPSSSGNGGYVCGITASYLKRPAAVRLSVPPPLSKTLRLETTSSRATLYDGDEVVATALPTVLTVEPPEPPTMPQTITATRNFRGFTDHRFPQCFVCGPRRGAGDGLRIFAGPVEGRDIVAAPWLPEPAFGGREMVDEPFVWAALDCPGGFAVWPDDPEVAIVLGELAVRINRHVPIGRHIRVIGWPIAIEGRKRRSGTALFDENNDVLAVGEAIWLTVPAAQFESG